jgi:Ca2+-transporting ATPase
VSIIGSSSGVRPSFEALTLSAGSLSAYGYGVARYGAGPRASTLGFTSLITGQILHAFSSRSEKYTIFDWSRRPPNRILTFTVAGSIALQGAVFLIPWLKNLLGITTLSFADTLVTAAGGVMPLFINEGAKKVFLQEYQSEPSAARSQPS